MTVETIISAVLIAVGLVGIVIPVLPGLVLVLAGVAVWAVPRGDVVGWTVLGVAVFIFVLGTIAKYLLPGRRLKDAGVPGWTIALGVVLGLIGFFVVPIVGLFLGFLLGVYLAELGRLRDHARAWPSTRAALSAVGWSILIELAAGLLATLAWIVGLVIG